jgi:hypothetical protein
MKNSDSILVDQTLHGYKSGHQLLKTSASIPNSVQRKMLVLSDLTGTGIQSGFEEYFSGYPLSEINSYALAKTWYAGEMERPGCVWTQTILISFSDLAVLDSPLELLRLFKRPAKSNEDFEFYSRQLHVPIESEPERLDLKPMDETIAREVIFYLYGSKNKSVIVLDDNSFRLSNLIFGLWFQQWPKLRRAFTFCTGAISPRYFDKVLFHFQIIPYISRFDSSVTANSSMILNLEETKSKKIAVYKWVDEIIKDLSVPSKLRLFMRRYGTDTVGGIAAVEPLVKTFLYFKLNSNSDLPSVILLLAKNFTSKNNAGLLKCDILFPPKPKNLMLFDWSYSTNLVFVELLTTQFYSAFDPERLKLSERFKDLYQLDYVSFFSIIEEVIKNNINVYGEQMLYEAAHIINEKHIEYLIDYNRTVFLTMESINPTFYSYRNVWKKLENGQEEYLDILLKSSNSKKINWETILEMLLDENINVSPDTFFHHNINILEFLFNSINKKQSFTLSYSWMISIRERPSEILYWLENNKVETIVFLHFLLSQLNPNANPAQLSPDYIWINLLAKYPTDSVLSSFVLAIALSKKDKDIIEIFAITFDNVYYALKEDNLKYDSWKNLEIHTAPLFFYNDWDKCKKIVNTVAKTFVDLRLPSNAVKKISRNPDVIKKIQTKIQKLSK